MTKQEFLEELQEILETEIVLDETVKVAEVPEWDSLTMFGIIAFMKESFDIDLKRSDFNKISTISDLMAFVSSQIE